mgnify:CR=1 FL=1
MLMTLIKNEFIKEKRKLNISFSKSGNIYYTPRILLPTN